MIDQEEYARRRRVWRQVIDAPGPKEDPRPEDWEWINGKREKGA